MTDPSAESQHAPAIQPQQGAAPEREPAPAAPTGTDTWEGILANLRLRYPAQKDSVLFCVYKLQQNPDLTLRDIRDEAALHGIPTAGRALHSGKVLLGLAEKKPRAPRPAAAGATPTLATSTERVKRPRRPDADAGDSIEGKVLDAVRQIQSAAGEESQRLRQAIQQAIGILQQALDEN